MTDSQRSLIRKSNNLITIIDGALTVGRSAVCGLHLTEGSPSRQHARLTVEGDQVWVEDLGSTNGTFINGVRITARTALKHSDSLRFDVEEYTYSAGLVDSDKTIMRPATAQQLPPGWIEGGGQGAGINKTVFKTPQELAEERRLAAAAAPVAAMQYTDVPVLMIASGLKAGTRTELRTQSSDKQEWSIGSDAAREVCLTDSGVSALHARIIKDGERWKLIDQVSANGTYVNGKRSTMSYLNSGDRIAFGPVECSFMLPGGPLAARDVPATAAGATTAAGKWSAGRIVVIGVISFVATLLLLYGLSR